MTIRSVQSDQEWRVRADQWRMGMGAFVVIVDAAGRVLLGHRRDADVWDLPGGGVEAGETPWEAAVRETAEETGLVVEVERLTGLYAKPAELVAVFRARVCGGELHPTGEADRHAWMPAEALPPNLSPNHAARIADALADPAGVPVLRRQPDYSAARPSAWQAGDGFGEDKGSVSSRTR